MNASPVRSISLALISLCLFSCNRQMERPRQEHRKVTAINPQAKAVTITQQYVGQIRAQHHIKVRALEKGYLEAIPVKEGQAVKQGDVLFKVLPILHQARLDAMMAEAQLAQLELNKKLSGKVAPEKVGPEKVGPEKVGPEKVGPENGLVDNELAQLEARVAKAKAQVAAAELYDGSVKAPFDGIVGLLNLPQGSLVEKGEILTTLFDSSHVWVYFNVPEARYLEYMADLNQHQEDLQVELVLANGSKFGQIGTIGAIPADFNRDTGNIAFRADFPNPDGLLRHGQSGNVLIHRVLHGAIVIPRQATFDILDKRYVFVVDQEDVAHQREIFIQNELEDILVVKQGLDLNDRIVLEGILYVRDGDKLEYGVDQPEQ